MVKIGKSKKYCVYKLTSPKGKVYVGITSLMPEKRWMEGKGYRFNPGLITDIEKYGWENFNHEVLFNELSQREAKIKEIELIVKYNSTDKKHGYNIESGGNFRKGRYYKPVICLTTNRHFRSIKEAGEFYGIRTAYISNCLTGRTNFAGEVDGKKLTWIYANNKKGD
ncbi:MAG: hypothetical protein JJT76_06880 [Clostridiaceae bacterium]|nr:hypothetical protein [Clostridiaceae bacterium]